MTISTAPSLSFDQAFNINSSTLSSSMEPRTVVLICIGVALLSIGAGYLISQSQVKRNVRFKTDPSETKAI